MKEREKYERKYQRERRDVNYPPGLIIKSKKANKSLLFSGACMSNKLFSLPNYPGKLRLIQVM